MQYTIWNPDPILVSFMGVHIYWYGAIFAAAIFSGFHMMKWIYTREGLDVESLETLFLYTFFGIVIGARLGHCLFYDPEYYLAHPLKILYVWEGGLASHGGGIGVLISLYMYAKKYKVDFLFLLDKYAVPTALFSIFVRMGNFMNSEILGKVTDVSWAIIFSKRDLLPRHPAQLYEAFAYLLIFLLLLAVYLKVKKPKKNGLLFGLFLVLVFSARILVEFVKVKQASYANEMILSTGQLLSLPFLLVGFGLIFYALKK
jgi:prolipoprotein diacylglyceryl transferase